MIWFRKESGCDNDHIVAKKKISTSRNLPFTVGPTWACMYFFLFFSWFFCFYRICRRGLRRQSCFFFILLLFFLHFWTELHRSTGGWVYNTGGCANMRFKSLINLLFISFLDGFQFFFLRGFRSMLEDCDDDDRTDDEKDLIDNFDQWEIAEQSCTFRMKNE